MGPLALRPGFIPTACSGFGTHSLWRDSLHSLDIVGRVLVLPQSNVLDFVDSPRKSLPSLRCQWGLRWGMGGRNVEGAEGGEVVGNRFGM